jgi:hypothetical protein
MAIEQMIDRLSSRTDRLATARGIVPEVAAIEIPTCMDRDDVLARHYLLYPQDAKAELTVVINRFGGADPDEPCGEHNDPKVSRAWRELARELQATRH